MDGLDAPIVKTAELHAAGLTKHAILVRVRTGTLVRLRRGRYVLGSVWGQLDARDRHLVRARAVCSEVSEPVLCGRSAAAVWRIPLIGTLSNDVTLVAPYRGGGKSEPGVRRTSVAASAVPVVRVGDLSVTSRERTVVDIAATEGFLAGVVAADWALRAGVTRSELERALAARRSRYGAATARAVIAFADGAAETPGESAGRASMFLLGFEVPQLQASVVDEEGEMRMDYHWPSVNVGGEFDGLQKYTRADMNGGSPSDVVVREKRREDRLRRRIRIVVRLIWSDVFDGERLTRLLVDAGVPRRRPGPPDPLRTGSSRP